MSHPAASTEGLTKHFGATVALDGVDFDVAAGEIHAVVGENGAGKSTLIRILGGVWRPDRGTVRVDGAARHFSSPRDAIAAGIVTIPQELRLVPALSIAENIALGDLPVRRFGPLAVIDRARMRDAARPVMAATRSWTEKAPRRLTAATRPSRKMVQRSAMVTTSSR